RRRSADVRGASLRVTLRPGTRHAALSKIAFGPPTDAGAESPAAGDEVRIELLPRYEFYMSGIGYGHPVWGHGRNRGELAVGFDAERLADADRNDPLHLHVQALCDARLELPDGSERRG